MNFICFFSFLSLPLDEIFMWVSAQLETEFYLSCAQLTRLILCSLLIYVSISYSVFKNNHKCVLGGEP